MNGKLLLGFVVIVAGLGIGWYVLKGTPSSPAPTPTQVTTVAPTPGETTTASRVSVTYKDNGFAPNTITIKVGTIVHFVNNSGVGMWVASDVHPTHQLLPGFDELASVTNGGSYDYTFVKIGTWTYHNHMNPTDKGIVVVTE